MKITEAFEKIIEGKTEKGKIGKTSITYKIEKIEDGRSSRDKVISRCSFYYDGDLAVTFDISDQGVWTKYTKIHDEENLCFLLNDLFTI